MVLPPHSGSTVQTMTSEAGQSLRLLPGTVLNQQCRQQAPGTQIIYLQQQPKTNVQFVNIPASIPASSGAPRIIHVSSGGHVFFSEYFFCFLCCIVLENN
jgi:hypothetical protein